MGTIDLIRATPNTIEAIRKAHAIRKDLMPDDSFQYSFPSSKPSYNGQWAVQFDGSNFKVPASSVGNLILTEDRVLSVVTNELQTYAYISEDSASWCYLKVYLSNDATSSLVSLETYTAPIQNLLNYSDYTEDYVPLAVYSQESGLIQLQYGPVRLNRYWVYDDGSGSGGGGGGSEEEA